MGKLVENYVIDDIEKDLIRLRFDVLHAKYIKTAKNAPVEKLFDSLGYKIVSKNDDETDYEIYLKNRPVRQFYVNQN